MKPTVGLVSRSGVIPISHSQDTAGPMARTVRDAAVLLTALAGTDLADLTTTDAGAHLVKDYTGFLNNNLKDAKAPSLRRHIQYRLAVLKAAT